MADPYLLLEKKRAAPSGGDIAPVTALSDDATPYGQAGLNDELAALSKATEGSRNDTLNRVALKIGRLYAGGQLGRNEQNIKQHIAATAQAIGLDDGEIRATIDSGWNAGLVDPRVPVEPPKRQIVLTRASDIVPVLRPAERAAAELLKAAETASRSSWHPVDISSVLAGQNVEYDVPQFLARQDGHRLFYAGKVNGLIGESESGKSWVALHTAHRAMGEGHRVTFLDFEDVAATIVGRLKALGCTDEHFQRFAYVQPHEPLAAGQTITDLDAHLKSHRPALVVLDGVNAAMSLFGFDPNSNRDFGEFNQSLLRRITATGAAALTIDHTGKNPNGKGPLGGQAKRAGVDGCTLLVKTVTPFGRGQRGELRLMIDKDRPGYVRGNSIKDHAGTLILAAQDEHGLIVVLVQPPHDGTDEPFRPTALMERVSRYLEAQEVGQSGNVVAAAVGGQRTATLTAIRTLVAESYATAAPHRTVRPYRQDEDAAGVSTSADIRTPA